MSPSWVETRHGGYFRLRRYRDADFTAEVLSAPGHDVVIVVGVLRDAGGELRFAVKTGDTRPSRGVRGDGYVKLGLVGGRLDHEGTPPAVIAELEVREELGGEPSGSLLELGEQPVPTMPSWSTEADLYYLAPLAQLGEPTGDGGGMEVPELLGVELRRMDEVLDDIRSGRIGEAARARVAYGRAFERLGLAPSLGGLEPGAELSLPSVELPARRPPPPVDGVELEVLQSIEVEGQVKLLLCQGWHSCSGRRRGDSFPVEILDVGYEELEVVGASRSATGWRVLLERYLPPVLSVKETLEHELRSPRATPSALWSGARARAELGAADHQAARLAESRGWGAPIRLLHGEASPGQSNLLESMYFAECAADAAGLVPLEEAVRRVRAEGGSARTEATLLELAARG